eukprot:COSAG03_NODE_429_length_7977_cov_3.949606_5_plen_156_part_00
MYYTEQVHLDGEGLRGTPRRAFMNWPLVDIDDANGPFEMAAGSHLYPVDEAHRLIAAGELPLRRLLMMRGDVLVRNPCCLHRGSPNVTETPRPMCILSFSESEDAAANAGNRAPAVQRSVLEGLSAEQRWVLRAIPSVEGAPHANVGSSNGYKLY